MVDQQTQPSLSGLLDGLLVAHRNDIHAFSAGHLNESNLRKSEAEIHKPWASSQKPRPVVVPASHLQKHDDSMEHRQQYESMKSTMAAFSFGADAIPDMPTPRAQRRETKKPSRPRSRASGSRTSDDSRKSDRVLVEEIHLPEVMLARTMYNRPKGWVEHDMEAPISGERKPESQGHIKDTNLAKHYSPRHHFLSGHQEAITKKDQYAKMKGFESDVLRMQDTMETQVMSGNKAVEHHEKKLHQLLQMFGDPSEPSLDRLRLYTSTFQDVITESTTLGYMLETFKEEYDSYINHLLQSNSGRHLVLQDQVEQLANRASHRPQALANEQKKLSALESDAKEALELNERLRLLLEEEQSRSASTTDKPMTATVYYSEPPLEASDHIEEAHADIMEKLDDINKERQTLKTHYVPSNIATHLEQSIKDTEVEIQKLMGQKDYFARSSTELETELTEVIEDADTTERDARRVWKKISAVKLEAGHGEGNGDGGNRYSNYEDSDEEYNEETKWSWYIS